MTPTNPSATRFASARSWAVTAIAITLAGCSQQPTGLSGDWNVEGGQTYRIEVAEDGTFTGLTQDGGEARGFIDAEGGTLTTADHRLEFDTENECHVYATEYDKDGRAGIGYRIHINHFNGDHELCPMPTY